MSPANIRLREALAASSKQLAALIYFLFPMYDDFTAMDRWSGEPLHCTYQAVIVAIATRHADAIDIKFLVGGRPVWISLPHLAWVKYKEESGKSITDPLAIQIAGHYLKSAIESGYDNGREMYTLSVDETLDHLHVVMNEFKSTRKIPMMPRVEA
jgi:hypothetical protein